MKTSRKSWTLQGNHPDRLVENRIVHTSEWAELNMFETFEPARSVNLEFNSPVLVSMVTGKKIMHFEGESPFDFLPNETLVLPSGKPMQIDFPQASLESPTRCIALSLSEKLITDTLNMMNETMPVGSEWKLQAKPANILRYQSLQRSLHVLIDTFLESSPAKPLLLELQLKHLVVRLLQSEARQELLAHTQKSSNHHPFAYIAQFIKENLHENLTVEQLSQKACMSASTFFRTFKSQFGITPVEYIMQCRIKKAKQMLSTTNYSVSEIAYQCGFSSPGYFIRTFKKLTGYTPKDYSHLIRA